MNKYALVVLVFIILALIVFPLYLYYMGTGSLNPVGGPGSPAPTENTMMYSLGKLSIVNILPVYDNTTGNWIVNITIRNDGDRVRVIQYCNVDLEYYNSTNITIPPGGEANLTVILSGKKYAHGQAVTVNIITRSGEKITTGFPLP